MYRALSDDELEQVKRGTFVSPEYEVIARLTQQSSRANALAKEAESLIGMWEQIVTLQGHRLTIEVKGQKMEVDLTGDLAKALNAYRGRNP